MSSRLYENKVFHLQRGVQGWVQLFGKASLDSGSAEVSGNGVASIASLGSGEYEVTLSNKYSGVVNAQLSVEAPTAADKAVQFTSETVAVDGKFVFTFFEAGSPADATVPAVVHMSLSMDNSSRN